MSKVVQEVRALSPHEVDSLVKDAATQFSKKQRWRQKVQTVLCWITLATGGFGGWLLFNLYFDQQLLSLPHFSFLLLTDFVFFGSIAFILNSMVAYDEKIHLIQDSDRDLMTGVLRGLERFLGGDHATYKSNRGLVSIARAIDKEVAAAFNIVDEAEAITFDTLKIVDQNGGLIRLAQGRGAVCAASVVLLDFVNKFVDMHIPEDDAAELRNAQQILRDAQPANSIAAE
jgi:hypothetical protein